MWLPLGVTQQFLDGEGPPLSSLVVTLPRQGIIPHPVMDTVNGPTSQ